MLGIQAAKPNATEALPSLSGAGGWPGPLLVGSHVERCLGLMAAGLTIRGTLKDLVRRALTCSYAAPQRAQRLC